MAKFLPSCSADKCRVDRVHGLFAVGEVNDRRNLISPGDHVKVNAFPSKCPKEFTVTPVRDFMPTPTMDNLPLFRWPERGGTVQRAFRSKSRLQWPPDFWEQVGIFVARDC